MNPFIAPEVSYVLPLSIGIAAAVGLFIVGFVLTDALRNLAGLLIILGAGALAATATLMTLVIGPNASKTSESLDAWLNESYGIEASEKVLSSLNPNGSKYEKNLEAVVDYKGEPTTVTLTPYEDGYILVNEAKDPLAQR
jgi:hypothetical protein